MSENHILRKQSTYVQTVRKTPRAILAIVLLCVAISIGSWKMFSNETFRKEQLIIEATSLTREYAIAVERRLKVSVSSLYSLASVIQVDESGTVPENFESIAKTQIDLYGGITNLQLAEDGIVQKIVPLKGNEGAIGHNIMVDANRRGGSLATIEKQNIVFIGPITLTQGGEAVIARYPVFTTYAKKYTQNTPYKEHTIDCETNETRKANCFFPGPLAANGNATHFWGFVIMLTLVDDVFLGLGFEKLTKEYGYDFRVRKKGQTSAFYHNQADADTELEEAVIVPISFEKAGVEWELETARMEGSGLSQELYIQMFLLVLVIAQSLYGLVGIITSERKNMNQRNMINPA